MKERVKIILITNKDDITTDFVVKALTDNNASFYRLNTDEIGRSINISLNFNNNKFFIFDSISNQEIDLLNIKSVYFRRPDIFISRNELTEGEYNFTKSEIYYTLEGIYRILNKAFWLNNVYKIRNAENKIYQLLIAKKLGLKIPSTLITNIPNKAIEFYSENNDNCIIKPIKSGLVEGITEEGVIFTSKINLTKENSQRISSCPTYFQNCIKKQGDIRVTIVGNSVFSAFIHSQNEIDSTIDWRKTTTVLEHSQYKLPEEISIKCITLLKELQLNFGAIDFVLDNNGLLLFLEINPNGQWAWIEKRLNYPISKKISELLIEKSIN